MAKKLDMQICDACGARGAKVASFYGGVPAGNLTWSHSHICWCTSCSDLAKSLAIASPRRTVGPADVREFLED